MISAIHVKKSGLVFTAPSIHSIGSNQPFACDNRPSIIFPVLRMIQSRGSLVIARDNPGAAAMTQVVLYVSILLPFCLLDAGWLTIMGRILYKPTLRDILLPTINLPPAIVFYLFFPIGILVFAAMPALKANNVTTALLYGAIFGAIAYGTYDLTNFATLRNWTMQISVLDICWGAFASATAASIGFFVARWFNA